MKSAIAIIILVAAVSSPAMDRFAALSMIESGDNDRAIGRDGEVSRYQILPALWREYSFAGEAPQHEEDARGVTQRIMPPRVLDFERIHGRPPTDFEWYLLWHRPGRVMDPTRAEADRAQRFANLCAVSHRGPTLAAGGEQRNGGR
jgi:hypothetical protein